MIENLNNTIFLLSSRFGFKYVVNKYISTTQIDTAFQDNNGLTALMWACRNGNTDIVELLLQENADLDIQDNSGSTALTWAILGRTENTVAIAKMLLNKTFNLNLQDSGGYTPLMWAADFGITDLVSLLIERKAAVDIRDNQGCTALTWAIKGRSSDVYNNVKILVRAGCHINIFDDNGYTPLMWAAEYGFTEVVSLLIEKQADVNLKDNNGNTAIAWAILGNSKTLLETITVLLESGADPKIPNHRGWNSLMLAASLRHVELVDLLLFYS